MSKGRFNLKQKFNGKKTISILYFLHYRRHRQMHKRLQLLELCDGKSFRLWGMYIKAMFYIYLRNNSDLCHLQHKLFGFYNPDKKCLQRGTDWVFK